jgi:hypothetical protein
LTVRAAAVNLPPLVASPRRRSALGSLLIAASLLTALLFAQPAHSHSALAAPELCAPCSWSLHAPSVLAAPLALAGAATLVVDVAPHIGDVPIWRAVTSARPRSPPRSPA